MSHTCSLAVRKNRYIVLPSDFEEAWKVSCLLLFVGVRRRLQILTFSSFSSASKTLSGMTTSWISVGHYVFTPHCFRLNSFMSDR